MEYLLSKLSSNKISILLKTIMRRQVQITTKGSSMSILLRRFLSKIEATDLPSVFRILYQAGSSEVAYTL
uniref:Uncharacterized protein n=1 Tax=Arundo donax TaxID=35708 RepID=A0A0A9HC73_ARUDO